MFMCMNRLFLVALVGVAGCGKSGGPTGTVTGRVTHQDTPLTEGTISFSSAGQFPVIASGVIQPDGTYSLRFGNEPGIPVGQYRVTVHPPAVQIDFAKPGPPAPRKEYPQIPPPYRNPATSPLEAEISEGRQELDFELTPD